MFARRDIKRGEQITFDYCQSSLQEEQQAQVSAVMASPSKVVSRAPAEPEAVEEEEEESQSYVKSECRCGAKNCRKVLF